MRVFFLSIQALVFFGALTARAGLTSSSSAAAPAACLCTDVADTIKMNNTALEVLNYRIARATSSSRINRYLRELQLLSQQSEANLTAAYASCQKKEAACRAQQNAAIVPANNGASVARPDVRTERVTEVNEELPIEEAPLENQSVSPRVLTARASVGGAPSPRPTEIVLRSSGAGPRAAGGKAFADVEVLPAFKPSFANDPLVSPGAGKGRVADPLFTLEQIAVHDGPVARASGAGARGAAAAREPELGFRAYGAADRGAQGSSGRRARGSADHGRRASGAAAPGNGASAPRAVAAKASTPDRHLRAVSAAESSADAETARASSAIEEPAEPGWFKYLPKFLADGFFRPMYGLAPKKRAPAAERAQIAGMHTDIFYNVNRAYSLAGDTLKR